MSLKKSHLDPVIVYIDVPDIMVLQKRLEGRLEGGVAGAGAGGSGAVVGPSAAAAAVSHHEQVRRWMEKVPLIKEFAADPSFFQCHVVNDDLDAAFGKLRDFCTHVYQTSANGGTIASEAAAGGTAAATEAEEVELPASRQGPKAKAPSPGPARGAPQHPRSAGSGGARSAGPSLSDGGRASARAQRIHGIIEEEEDGEEQAPSMPQDFASAGHAYHARGGGSASTTDDEEGANGERVPRGRHGSGHGSFSGPAGQQPRSGSLSGPSGGARHSARVPGGASPVGGMLRAA